MLDGEREQRLGHLALERGGVIEKTHLHQLLSDRGRAFDRVARLDVDDRGARDAAGIDTRFGVEVPVFDGDDGVGHVLAHRAQRFVVMLVARRVQVGEHGLAVGRVHERIAWNVLRKLRHVGQCCGVGNVRRC